MSQPYLPNLLGYRLRMRLTLARVNLPLAFSTISLAISVTTFVLDRVTRSQLSITIANGRFLEATSLKTFEIRCAAVNAGNRDVVIAERGAFLFLSCRRRRS